MFVVRWKGQVIAVMWESTRSRGGKFGSGAEVEKREKVKNQHLLRSGFTSTTCFPKDPSNGADQDGHEGWALARSPQSTVKEAAMMAMPTLMNPAVIRDSCQAGAVRPAAVTGESAAVPKIAASVVTNQLT